MHERSFHKLMTSGNNDILAIVQNSTIVCILYAFVFKVAVFCLFNPWFKSFRWG